MLRIALDAMGGDHAPGPIVTGAIQALAADTDMTVVLVGNETEIRGLLPSDYPADRLEIFHATQVVGMNESPVEALRAKPDNTISRLWQLMGTKKVDAIVGAGSTGAMVAGGLFSRRFLKHVKRPGIAALMPTAKGTSIIIDVGANVHPKPGHLYQYGVIGAIYARYLLGKENPTVGLMNVGEEEGKGHDLAQKAYSLLKEGLKDRFIGNIEGRDIHRGVCDVVVTDGFVGNVVLKLSEGVFDFVMRAVSKEIVAPLPNDQAVAAKALYALINKYDYSAVGGAALMGIDGICIICHGSSKEVAIRNALAMAARSARQKINEKIVLELDALPKLSEEDS